MNYNRRIKSLRNILSELNADCFITNYSSHLKYLVNFSGSNGICLVTKNKIYFATDYRYEISSKKEVVSDFIFIDTKNLFEVISSNSKIEINTAVIDEKYLSVESLKYFKKYFKPKKIINSINIIEKISSIKEEAEVNRIKNAISISEKVFYQILKIIKPGISELDISSEISYLHKKFGASGDAFEPIVASGVNGAKPHAGAQNKKIKNNELITLDFGCYFKNYCSDITRTISIGKPSKKLLTIYKIVKEAQQIGLENIKIGIQTNKIDKIVRDFISKNGFGDYFKHSLGHGIGLAVHEQPMISKLSKSKIEIGNVVTIEPGIYLPNYGGVRIEDNVYVSKNGIEVLTKLNKELIIL